MPEGESDGILQTDLNKAGELLRILEKGNEARISFGTLALWLLIVKQAEGLPDNISMAEFHKVLSSNPNKYATINITEGE